MPLIHTHINLSYYIKQCLTQCIKSILIPTHFFFNFSDNDASPVQAIWWQIHFKAKSLVRSSTKKASFQIETFGGLSILKTKKAHILRLPVICIHATISVFLGHFYYKVTSLTFLYCLRCVCQQILTRCVVHVHNLKYFSKSNPKLVLGELILCLYQLFGLLL